MNKPDHHLLLAWLIVAGVIVFGFAVAWNEGLIHRLVSADQSKLSFVIALLYIVAAIHGSRRIFFISNQIRIAGQLGSLFRGSRQTAIRELSAGAGKDGGDALPEGYATQYIRDVLRTNNVDQVKQEGSVSSTLAELYAAKVRGGQEFGWFIVDLMIKLGLLGTIIGFILMLGSVSEVSTLDVTSMQRVLKEMSNGMGTALYTTLAGLTGSVLLAAQYALLDRGGDELIEKTVYLAEIHVRPHIGPAT